MVWSEAEDRDDHARFQEEWMRFRAVYERRHELFSSPRQQRHKSTSRLFILSRRGDPWNVFGLQSRREYRQRVFELSGLHMTALHQACIEGDQDVVQLLLASNAGCSLARDCSGRVPLHHAVIREQHRIIRRLLKLPDARLQLHARDHRDLTPVQYVLEKIHRVALKKCPGQRPAEVATELRGSFSRYRRLWVLADRMLTAMEAGTVQQIQELDFLTRGDLWDAVRAGDLERVKSIVDIYGELDESHVRLGHLGWTLLHEATTSRMQDYRVLVFVVTEFRLDRLERDQTGSTPLHYAARQGWLEACVFLLDDINDNGSAVDSDMLLMATDARGRTPLHGCLRDAQLSLRLHEAVSTGRYIAKRCPQALQVHDYDGFSPLHYAVALGDTALVLLLINLGANLDAGAICQAPKKRDYGDKADWAPCGSCFMKRLKLVKGVASTTTSNSNSDVKAEDEVRPVAHSVACTRLRKVKDGQVEHPGAALPMETLWFLVRKPNKAIASATAARGTMQDPTTLSPPVKATEVEQQRFGCRRFGAVCSLCTVATDGSDTATEIKSLPKISVSPLTLSIRCCRLKPHASRMGIVEYLFTSGAPASPDIIREVLCGPTTPSLVQTILTFYGQPLNAEQIYHFIFRFHGDDSDCENILQQLLPEIEIPLLISAIPLLFRTRLFRVVDHLLACRNSEAENILTSPNDWPATSSYHKVVRRSYPLALSHIDVTKKWLLSYPDVMGFNNLTMVCISSLLDAPYAWSASRRSEIDTTLSETLDILMNRGALSEEKTHHWIAKTVRRGLFASLRRLWQFYISRGSVLLLTKTCLAFFHPLERYNQPLYRDLVEMLLGATTCFLDSSSDQNQVLNLCIAIACIFNQPLDTVRCRVCQITQGQQAESVCKLLSAKRFHGRTPVEWIIEYDRVDVAELLLSSNLASFSPHKELIWSAMIYSAWVSGAKFTSSSAGVWLNLLLSDLAELMPMTPSRTLLLKRVVHCKPPLALFDHIKRAILRFSSSNESKSWAQDAKLLHEIARWNSIDLMALFLEVASTDNATSSLLAALISERDGFDQLTAVEVCYQLGHFDLARLMQRLSVDETTNHADTDEPKPREPQNPALYGLLRSIMTTQIATSSQRPIRAHKNTRSVSATAILSGNWAAAVVWNDIRSLNVFSLAQVPLPTDSDSKSNCLTLLLEVAIIHGSFDALAWLLQDISMKRFFPLPPETSAKMLHLAAKHSSGTNSRMTLLLLQHPGFSPGRLSGDGVDITLLHRIACFTEATTASECMALLFQVADCDPNVRDGFGLTPVAYAIASGNIATACTLISHPQVRMEAEYEGQSVFYYCLHLLPSFSWRLITQCLLKSRRHGAFLHCTLDDCACKGFDPDATATDTCCAFCGHTFDSHSRVPLPPWFRDQYETYNAPHDHHGTTVPVDEDEDAIDARHRAMLAAPVVDEAALEHSRGRLSSRDLHILTQLRFAFLLQRHELALPPLEDAPDDATPPSTLLASPMTAARPRLPASTPEPPDSPSSLPVGGPSSPPRRRSIPIEVEVAALPWEMRGDVAMVHGEPCRFCTRQVALSAATSARTLLHTAVAAWLLASAENRRGKSVPGEQPAARAWRHWCDVTIESRIPVCVAQLAPSTSTCASGSSFHGCCDMGQDAAAAVASPSSASSPTSSLTGRPVALDVTATTSCASSIEEESGQGYQSDSEERSGIRASIPIPLTIGLPELTRSAVATNRISVLQLFVFHWRYARVYQCFRIWKRRSVNGQVVHHELEALADAWSAEQRRERYRALVQRQHALEEQIRDGGLKSAW